MLQMSTILLPNSVPSGAGTAFTLKSLRTSQGPNLRLDFLLVLGEAARVVEVEELGADHVLVPGLPRRHLCPSVRLA